MNLLGFAKGVLEPGQIVFIVIIKGNTRAQYFIHIEFV